MHLFLSTASLYCLWTFGIFQMYSPLFVPVSIQHKALKDSKETLIIRQYPRGTTRVEISHAYGQKSIEINWKSREISEKWKSEICRARAAFLLRIAPLTVVNYKADPVAARAHASHSFWPAGHTLERPRNAFPRNHWKSVEITRKSGNLLNWKSVEITWKSGNQLEITGF